MNGLTNLNLDFANNNTSNDGAKSMANTLANNAAFKELKKVTLGFFNNKIDVSTKWFLQSIVKKKNQQGFAWEIIT